MKDRVKKGSYGYIDYMRKAALLKTIILYLAALCVFCCGLMLTGKKENVITVAAVLIVLPASRSLVNAIMFMRFHTGDIDIFERTEKEGIRERCFFDSVLTLERGGSYFIDVLCIGDKMICHAPGADKSSITVIEKHISDMLRSGGINGCEVSVTADIDRFFSRAKGVAGRISGEEFARRFELIGAISL